MLGLIATRSLDTPVEGIHPLVDETEQRIRNGLPAYEWLQKAGGGTASIPPESRRSSFADLGYALLLKGVRPDAENATAQDIKEAAHSTIPDVPVLFWSFRIMVALGFYFIALFGWSFYLVEPVRRIRGLPTGFLARRPVAACRCPGSPPSLAGSSPNMAASLGSSTA